MAMAWDPQWCNLLWLLNGNGWFYDALWDNCLIVLNWIHVFGVNCLPKSALWSRCLLKRSLPGENSGKYCLFVFRARLLASWDFWYLKKWVSHLERKLRLTRRVEGFRAALMSWLNFASSEQSHDICLFLFPDSRLMKSFSLMMVGQSIYSRALLALSSPSSGRRLSKKEEFAS
jgi:hypothetical protein